MSKGRTLHRNNHWTQFAARSYGVPKSEPSVVTATPISTASFSVKPSHVKQLGIGRFSGRLKRSDKPSIRIEVSDENSEDVTDNENFKTWEELDTEIEARMRRDSEIEEFGEKVIEERSAAYPHQNILDGYSSPRTLQKKYIRSYISELELPFSN